MAWEHGYLNILKEGILSTHEANTSCYVHKVLCKCLNWKMEDIHPQKNAAEASLTIVWIVRFRVLCSK
jgi:hypothetical protein